MGFLHLLFEFLDEAYYICWDQSFTSWDFLAWAVMSLLSQILGPLACFSVYAIDVEYDVQLIFMLNLFRKPTGGKALV